MGSGSKLGVCSSCRGFVPAGRPTCVHCGARSPGSARALLDRFRVGALGGALGGGAIAFTLMACYGAPPCDDGTRHCYDDDGDVDAGRDAGRDARLPDVSVGEAAAPDAEDAPDGGEDDDASADGGDAG